MPQPGICLIFIFWKVNRIAGYRCMSYKLYQLSGGNHSLFKNDRQEKLSKFSIFSQKFRKKLYYFTEKQEIQFASLEVEKKVEFDRPGERSPE